ncbi:endothelin-converting enzyme 1-like isoform X2 [Ornithodoros turicata]|uniref:endothelin-converting enzyme 1-like isoform X2 n=1 Tax=Ornithodoros turicata TaxID=34597 RepID=UPI003139931E
MMTLFWTRAPTMLVLAMLHTATRTGGKITVATDSTTSSPTDIMTVNVSYIETTTISATFSTTTGMQTTATGMTTNAGTTSPSMTSVSPVNRTGSSTDMTSSMMMSASWSATGGATGTATGSATGTARGTATGTPMGTGTGTPIGTGTGTPMGTGTGTPMGTGTGTPMGTGTGTPMGNGTGTPMGNGTSTPMGHGTGSPMGTETGMTTAYSSSISSSTPCDLSPNCSGGFDIINVTIFDDNLTMSTPDVSVTTLTPFYTSIDPNNAMPESKPYPTDYEVCNTSFCVAEGTALNNSFSSCCEPCENFYGYVCREGWPIITSPNYVEDEDHTGYDTILARGIETKIRQVLDATTQGYPSPLQSLWSSCKAKIQTPPTAEIQRILTSLGCNPIWTQLTADDVLETVGNIMNRMDISPLLFFEIDRDPSSNKWILSLAGPDVLISTQRVENDRTAAITEFTNLACLYFRLTHGTTDQDLCEGVAEIAVTIAETSTLKKHPVFKAENYQIFHYWQLQHIHKLMNTVMGPSFAFTATTRILVKLPSFVNVTLKQLLSTPGRKWRKPAKWRVCVHLINKLLPTLVTHTFSSPLAGAKGFYELMGDVMAEEIRAAFLESIPDIRFLDLWSRNIVLTKVKNIQVYTFFPLRLSTTGQVVAYESEVGAAVPDYRNNSLAYFLDVSQYVAGSWKQEGRLRYFHKRWRRSIFDTKCEYIFSDNAIILPVGLFDFAIPTSAREKMFHIPRIGPRITECLFQVAFESASYYNPDELLWTEDSRSRYQDTLDCFAKQYSYEKYQLSELYTAAQDNAAILVSYKVFFDQLFTIRYFNKDYQLQGLTNVTARQLFFIYYARGFCRIGNQKVKTEHENRVNIPLMNSNEFAEAFGCPVSSEMNPVEKCYIWE